MSMLGVQISLLIGPTVPVPAPPPVIQALDKVEVTHKARGCSGFQLVFRLGRNGPTDIIDYSLLSMVKTELRAIIVVTFNAIPRVLSDGIITHIQVISGNGPGEARLCATGEDVGCAMTLEEKEIEHPAQPEPIIAAKIIAEYSKYGMIPAVIPPPLIDPPIPTERTPVQRSNDRDYLNLLGERFGYVFHITPGPVPGVNTAYWGPPKRLGVPQPALTVNMGPATNVVDIKFRDNSQKAVQVSGHVQDRLTNKKMPVQSLASTRLPLSITRPTLLNARKVLPPPSSGLNTAQAIARAVGIMDASFDDIVRVEGTLDTIRYNHLLEPRRLVGLRGVGLRSNGLYYVSQVTHCISSGKYTQAFQLSREGLGSLLPVLPV